MGTYPSFPTLKATDSRQSSLRRPLNPSSRRSKTSHSQPNNHLLLSSPKSFRKLHQLERPTPKSAVGRAASAMSSLPTALLSGTGLVLFRKKWRGCRIDCLAPSPSLQISISTLHHRLPNRASKGRQGRRHHSRRWLLRGPKLHNQPRHRQRCHCESRLSQKPKKK